MFTLLETFLVIFICFLLAILFVFVNYVLSVKVSHEDKLVAYECGFEAFSDARKKFDIHFYIVAILFILFDLEIVFLIPWTVHLSSMSVYSLSVMFFFLILFFVGFLYEWKEGALDWVVNFY